MVQWLTNLTSIHKGCRFDPWPDQWVGDPALLWLGCRPAAVAPIRPLAWEPPYAAGVAKKKKKKMKDGEWWSREQVLLWNRLSSSSHLLSPGILSSQDGPVLGAVGSFSWSGGAFLYPPHRSPAFINMSQEDVDMRDSYLGEARLRLGDGQGLGSGEASVLRPGPPRLLGRAGHLERGTEPGPGGPAPSAHREGGHLHPDVQTVEAEG